jgi:hypothetical protein
VRNPRRSLITRNSSLRIRYFPHGTRPGLSTKKLSTHRRRALARAFSIGGVGLTAQGRIRRLTPVKKGASQVPSINLQVGICEEPGHCGLGAEMAILPTAVDIQQIFKPSGVGCVSFFIRGSDLLLPRGSVRVDACFIFHMWVTLGYPKFQILIQSALKV